MVNLVQAIFTPIHNDEVYYAVWGQHLAMGFFDHPPMVAVLTYLGSHFFSDVLGVRFFTVILQTFSLVLLWKTIDEKYRESTQSVWLFFIVAFSLVMFSVYGFTTTPDSPMLFFAALFLFAYKRFLANNRWADALWLSVAMAGMLYSKYHGVLFIGFTILSNLKLLKNGKFWGSGLLAIALLVPHIYWQYANDFLSFQYHLVSRHRGFDLSSILEFFPGQLGVFNPFTLGAVIYVLWKFRSKNAFERTLYFLIIGILGFFTLSTFRGRAEAHWTVSVSIPILILLVHKANESEKLKKYIFKYVGLSLVLIFMLRILLFTDIAHKFGYKNQAAYYKNIEKIAGDSPVLFNQSFQEPSYYQFYTQKPATTVSAIENRQTQYDIWQNEQDFANQKVFIAKPKANISKKYTFGGQVVEGFFTENLQASNRLKINYDLPFKTLNVGQTLTIPITIVNPTQHSIDFNHSEFPLSLNVVFLIHKRNYHIIETQSNPEVRVLKPNEIQSFTLTFKVPDLEKGTYKFSVLIDSFFGHTLNSKFQTLEIE